MIPENISRKNILDVLNNLDINDIPPRRKVRDYYIDFNNSKEYPPKYIISLANKIANGQELSHKEFNGGWASANKFLAERGFTIQQF